METRANYILIGAFMVAILVAAFGFVYWLAATAESRQNVALQIVFPGKVTGLPVGGQVQFNGIKVGDVSSLEFMKDDPTKVIANVNIKPSTPLRNDTQAMLNFTGLTGVAYVDLSGGSSDAPLILDRDDGKVPVIYAEKSFFDDIVDGARNVINRADSTLTTIDDFLLENRDGISNTLANVETFSGALASNADGVEDFMESIGKASDAFSSLSVRLETLVMEGERLLAAVPSDKVTAIVDEIAAFSESLGRSAEGIDKLLANATMASEELQTFSKRLNEGLADVQRVVEAVKPEDVEKIVGGAARFTELLDKRAPELDQLVTSSASAVDGINRIVSAVSEREDQIGAILDNGEQAVAKIDVLASRGVEIADAIDPSEIDQIVASLNGFATGLNGSLEQIDQVIASVDPDKVSETVDGLAAIIGNVNEQQGQINEIIASTKSTVQNFEALSATLRSEDGRIAGVIEDVSAAADRFAVTLESANTLLAAVDPAKVGNIVGSVETAAAGLTHEEDGIAAILETARKAADNVEQLTSDLAGKTPDVDEILSDAKEMTATLNATSVRVESLVEKVTTMVDADGEGLITEATRAAQAISKIAVAFESRADTIAGGMAKFATKGSADFSAALAQLNRTLVSIQRTVENFDRNPNRVIFGGDDVPTFSGSGRRR